MIHLGPQCHFRWKNSLNCRKDALKMIRETFPYTRATWSIINYRTFYIVKCDDLNRRDELRRIFIMIMRMSSNKHLHLLCAKNTCISNAVYPPHTNELGSSCNCSAWYARSRGESGVVPVNNSWTVHESFWNHGHVYLLQNICKLFWYNVIL